MIQRDLVRIGTTRPVRFVTCVLAIRSDATGVKVEDCELNQADDIDSSPLHTAQDTNNTGA